MNESELLSRALDNEPVPRDLESRLRTQLEMTTQARSSFYSGRGKGTIRLVSSLAMLLIVVGGMALFFASRTSDLLTAGVNDHVLCAVASVYPRQTDRAEMTAALGSRFAPMLQPVFEAAGGKNTNELVSAHQCTKVGRTYTHIILRRGTSLVSVILTLRGTGDEFPADGLERKVTRSMLPLHNGTLRGYSVAGFQTGGWLGYVVSSMPEQQNRELALRIAPVVGRYTRS